MFKQINQPGITLLEVMVAASVFMIGLTAMLTSAVSLFMNMTVSGDYLVASNLAREGLEVIRNRRDDNFVAGRDWNDGLILTRAIIKPNLSGGFQGKFVIDSAGYTITECLNTNHDCQVTFDPISGLYGDVSMMMVLSDAFRTKYHRLLSFTPIFCTTAMAAASLCSGVEQIGVTVSSAVAWYQGERLRQIEAKTDLYNWY